VLLLNRPGCSLANAGFDANMVEGRSRGARAELLIQQEEQTVRTWIGPSAPLAACGANLYLDSYGLNLGLTAADGSGQPLEVAVPGTGTLALDFPEGTTSGSFLIPSLETRITVAPSPLSLAGLVDEPVDLQVQQTGQDTPLFQGSVDPKDDLQLPGASLRLHPGVYLKVVAVHDPGFPAFLAAGLVLALGSAFSLLFPPRRLWARLTEEGALQVCLAPEEERWSAPMGWAGGGER
jgi:hypothetical protein